MNVSFQPLVPGTRTGTLTISDNAPGSPHIVSLTGVGAAPWSSDTTPPTVSLVFPIGRLSKSVIGKITATDNIGVVRIEVYKDGTLFGSSETSRYSFSWDTTKENNGPHTFIAVAYDAANNRSSNLVTVEVQNVAPPSIAIIAPAPGAAIDTPWFNLISQVRSNAPVSMVQFKLDGLDIGPQLRNGLLSLTWDTTSATAGNHTISAVVTDTLGNVAVSPRIAVQIIRASSTPAKRTSSGRRF